MTVTVQTPRDNFVGNGIQDTFAFGFRLLNNADIIVSVDDNVQVEITDYTIQNLTALGGDVVFEAGSIPPNLSGILLRRSTSLDQETDYIPFDAFPAETHETGLDKLTMQIQDLDSELDNFDSQFLGLDPTLTFWEGESKLIKNVLDPEDAQDVATKNYIDNISTIGDTVAAADEIITGEWSFNSPMMVNANIRMANDTVLTGRDTGGTNRALIELDDNDEVQVGNTSSDMRLKGGDYIFPGGVARFDEPIQVNGLLFPAGLGNNGQVLTTDGIDQLRWATVGSGGIGADPTADESITGQWSFSQTILGTTDGNLTQADLTDIAELDSNEIVTGIWTFNNTINGVTNGNPQFSDIGNFTADNVAEVITAAWEFTGVIQFGEVDVLSANPQFRFISTTGGVENANIINTATEFRLGPNSTNIAKLTYVHADDQWMFVTGIGGNIARTQLPADGSWQVRNVANNNWATVLNRLDDFTHIGAASFSQVIDGTCNGNIAITEDADITGNWRYATPPQLLNEVALLGNLVGDIATAPLIGIDNTDKIILGAFALDMEVRIDNNFTMIVDAAEIMRIGAYDAPVDGPTILDRNDLYQSVGFRRIPRRIFSADYIPTVFDEGGISEWLPTSTSHNITFNLLSSGRIDVTYLIQNSDNADKNLLEGTGVIYWYDGSGVAKTGNRTLAPNSVINVLHVSDGVQIWGNGIS